MSYSNREFWSPNYTVTFCSGFCCSVLLLVFFCCSFTKTHKFFRQRCHWSALEKKKSLSSPLCIPPQHLSLFSLSATPFLCCGVEFSQARRVLQCSRWPQKGWQDDEGRQRGNVNAGEEANGTAALTSQTIAQWDAWQQDNDFCSHFAANARYIATSHKMIDACLKKWLQLQRGLHVFQQLIWWTDPELSSRGGGSEWKRAEGAQWLQRGKRLRGCSRGRAEAKRPAPVCVWCRVLGARDTDDDAVEEG